MTAGARRARAADSVQPRAPRRRQRHRLPLLPHLGRGLLVRRHPADQDLHELPLADLRQQPVPRAGARQLPHRPLDRSGPASTICPTSSTSITASTCNKGVGCTTCHGQVDRMPLMWQEQSLQMEWCLDCHRNPERYVRPRDAVFRVDYVAAAESGSSSASGWSRSIRFRSSRAARRAIDEANRDRAGVRGAEADRPRRLVWRTLDERADDPAFQEHLYNEFPVARSKRSPIRSRGGRS